MVLQSNEGYRNDCDWFTVPQSDSFISEKSYFTFWNLWYFVRGIKSMIRVLPDCAAFLPTIIPCFWVTLFMFCLPAVTKCHYRNMVTVQPVYVQVKGGEWCKNEEHLRYIKFATGWTVTLPYWAAGVKQGLTTSTPPLASPSPPLEKKPYLHPTSPKKRRWDEELWPTWGEERGTKRGLKRTRGGPEFNNCCMFSATI